MRYLMKFTKENEIKFVSHLELMRTLQRIIKRADLPAEYSKGFNPHMILSIAQPLSVGTYSNAEYMDIHFTEELDEKFIKDELNKTTPRGINFIEVIKVSEKMGDKKTPQAMAVVDAARYILKVRYNSSENILKTFEELMNKDEWITSKKTKKGTKEVNIKPMIRKIKYLSHENVLLIDMIVDCGSKSNLSANLMGEYIRNNTLNADKDAFIDVERQELYACKNEEIISLSEYFKK